VTADNGLVRVKVPAQVKEQIRGDLAEDIMVIVQKVPGVRKVVFYHP